MAAFSTTSDVAQRRAGRPGLLEPEQIIGMANQMLDEGPGALSMRALARRLGVTPGTLYNYFPSRQALMLSVLNAREAFTMPRLNPDDPRGLARQLVEFAQIWRDYSERRARHIADGGPRLWAHFDSPEMLEAVYDTLHDNMRVLVDHGLSPQRAKLLLTTLIQIAHAAGAHAAENSEGLERFQAAAVQLDRARWPLFGELVVSLPGEDRDAFGVQVRELVDLMLTGTVVGER